MHRKSCLMLIGVSLLIWTGGDAFGQSDRTVGVLTREDGCSPGYTLIASQVAVDTYLIDLDGRIVNQWTTLSTPGNSVYLLPNGDLLRGAHTTSMVFNAGGSGGRLERFSWDGDLEWAFEYDTLQVRSHHDVEPMPNGHVLVVAWEMKTFAEAVAAGRDPALLADGQLWPDHIIEVQPVGPTGGSIVWEWHAWDHLIQDFDSSKPNYGDPAENPGRIDINYPLRDMADWNHVNAIDYNAELDQILVSCPTNSEIWIIDHATTTAEAAGEAGDLLYRWGNPAAYGRGTEDDQQFFFQHDARWVPEDLPATGDIMVFNNGQGRNWSSIDRVSPPLLADDTYELVEGAAYGPSSATVLYEDDPAEDFFCAFISGAEYQPNGNLLVCAGPYGNAFEITPAGELVWDYVSPVIGSGVPGRLFQGETLPPLGGGPGGGGGTANFMFRAPRYATDFPGFKGRDLTPGEFLELYPECIGDINGDRFVDGADLSILLGAWGTPDADLDDDGLTGGSDLAVLLGAWGECAF